MTDDLDLPSLAARLLRPPGAQREAVRAVVTEVGEPAAAWEALATRGLIPEDWVESATRSFWCRRCNGRGMRVVPAPEPAALVGCAACVRGLCPRPSSHEACVALAGDVAAVLTAEALAAEARARLAPWGIGPAPRAAWRVTERWLPAREGDAPSAGTRSTTLASVRAAISAAVRTRWGDPRDPLASLRTSLRVADPGDPAWDGLARDVRAREAWRLAAALGCVAPPDAGAHAGRLFNELPNPFEPIVALWSTGFALEEVLEHAVLLVAPSRPG